MHDLTLAAQYADRVLLMDAGKVVADGPPAAVLDEERLGLHYGASVSVLRHEGGPRCSALRINTLRSRPIHGSERRQSRRGNRPYAKSHTPSMLWIATRHEPRTVRPTCQASMPAEFALAVTAAASAGATSTTIPTPMLNARNISSAATSPAVCSCRNTFGTFHVRQSISASTESDNARFTLPGSPPPVM